MIINVKGTKIRLVIPEGFRKLKEKNLFKDLQNGMKGIDTYRKATSGANCVVTLSKIAPESSMNIDDCEGLIEKIHSSLSDNQGIIVAQSGETKRGYRYIYSIVRTVLNEEKYTGATYYLRMNLECGKEYVEIKAGFRETGTSGIRDNMGMFFARRAKLVDLSTRPIAGWREDPYDPTFVRGLPMNLSEREGLDGLFPGHPLSQAREFVHAVLCDELMLDPNDPSVEKRTGKVETGEAEPLESNQNRSSKEAISRNADKERSQEEIYRWMLSKEVQRRFIPLKIEIEQPKKRSIRKAK